ncbi:BMP family ABC transporter substrate-binding protein [Blastococcus sp. BMG 814]|uniref:BMP family ABC transporter substrate-binding protein n=1 Tax=Blastococcus carthaginiensis TaxID=3050034 RepID=A0ABT9IBD4_9ACTN|nr:BMP family ABC transporter substrate-binding protein [Blastococcus carthaginiensis]MDP5182873.1 BMP family ABC transporter substrate-binding protein [Blastococcus carthaginiensis]
MRRARMTKAAALLLAGSLALAACASDEEPTAGGNGGGDGGSDDLQVGLAYDVGGRGDQSFNDSAYAGVEAAIAALGGEVQEFSPNDDGSDRVEGLANLAEAGYDPVIGVGFAYADTIAEVAEEFPDTTFAVVDASVADSGLENATGLLFAEEQGSFLAGVAAALKSETGHVGFVGGVEMPLIQKFEAGFTAGAKAVDPDIQVDVEYISPAGDFTGFGDPARGQILARSMYDAGADIVFHAAGGSGSGVFQAAADTGNRAIGVDSDQYQTVDDPALQAVIMTSMLKRVDNAVEAFITDYSEGNVQGGIDILNDLESDGVGLATSGGQIDDIQQQIEDYRQRIISGEITVPTTP